MAGGFRGEAFGRRFNAGKVRILPVDPGHPRETIAGLVAEGDKAQFADADWRRELAGWLRHRGAADGLTTPKLVAPFARGAVRHLNLGKIVAGKDADLTRKAPLLLVLWSDRDGERTWLGTGRLLEDLSLRAAVDDVQADYRDE